ncbi:ROK family protein [Virgibacillus sp. NKC19-3]|uniref:ROK family protein n=1 Tax=Virgibacillus saliphilus TaxID=2831674 RepID=UPI001C9B50CE|nr:ROK family protein [Virgibacillus sp. NKC19-3]MBY7142902.1 ROK family protein [Virgibacillus sp. NKC19-3]
MENILAFDWGGTNIKYALVDQNGKIINKNHAPTPESLEDLFVFIERQLQEQLSKEVTGIAISSPGSVAEDGVIHGSSAIPYIHGPNMKDLIERRTGLPVHIENDANCAALAEVWKGAASGKKDVAVVVIGTGVGGALIKDGMIHKGSHLHGGEFGYMILQPAQLGNGMNTFSEVASTFSMIKRVAHQKGLDRSSLTGEEIFLKAEQGDNVCIQAISEFYQMLAIGLYNIQYIYDPEMILIGGGISDRKDLIYHLEEKMKCIVNKIDVATMMPVVNRCYLSADSNLIGAVYHYLQKQLKSY